MNKLSHKQLRDDGKSSQLKVIWLCWLMFQTLEQTPPALFPVLELPGLVTDIVLQKTVPQEGNYWDRTEEPGRPWSIKPAHSSFPRRHFSNTILHCTPDIMA